MKKLTILCGLFLAGVMSFGQTYFMSNNSETTCSGDFYDSGGPFLNYGSNENFTKTFTPATSGAYLQFNFTSF